MIDVLLIRSRAELRRRWFSLAMLALLIGLSGAVTLTAFAGARRSESAPERFMRADGTSDAIVDLGEQNTLRGTREITRLPQVAKASVVAFMAAWPLESFAATHAPTDSSGDSAVNRGIIIEGRNPSATATDEVALSEAHARLLHAHVGDHITYGALNHPEADRCAFVDEQPKSCDVLFRRPRLQLRVVGILRTGSDVNDNAADSTSSKLGGRFFTRYRDEIAWSPIVMVQLKDGASPQAFVSAVHAVAPEGVSPRVDLVNANATTDAVDVLTTGLVLFALVALAAGAFAVGQALIRQIAVGDVDRSTLGSLGAGRTLLVADAVLPVAYAAIAGGVVAVVGAFIASSRMPIGFARRIEPHRGMQFDPLVLGLGAAAIVVLVVGVALVTAWRASSGRARSERPGSVTLARVASASTVPAFSVGLAHAFARGRGAGSVPVRSALVAVAAASAGVVAVLGFSAGLTHLIHTPRLYGWSYDAIGIVPEHADELTTDQSVEAVADVWAQFEVRVKGRPVLATSLKARTGDIGPVIVAGRAPAVPGEVALGADTMRAASVGIGDIVKLSGPNGSREMRVVGRGVFAAIDDTRPLADGVYLAPDDVETVGSGDGIHTLAVRLGPHADRAAELERLARLGDANESFSLPVAPAEIDKLRQVEFLPKILAGFLALLGLIALAHALVVSVRRRAGEFAVLRAIGFLRRDVRAAVSLEAAAIAVVGTAIGIPVGVLIGRFAWSRIADSIGVLASQRVPVVVLVAIVPIAVLAAVGIALVPARRASRLRPAEILRSE